MLEVTESLEAASHTVSETMGTSTSSSTLELVEGQDALLPQPEEKDKKRQILILNVILEESPP